MLTYGNGWSEGHFSLRIGAAALVISLYRVTAKNYSALHIWRTVYVQFFPS